VLVKLGGASPQRASAALAEIPLVARSEILATDAAWVVARAYPRKPGPEGALAARVAELALREGWKIEELVVEEGRLDDVFRSLTWSETASKAREGANA
jgi:ABC-2 type transport system ATP-binding protein